VSKYKEIGLFIISTNLDYNNIYYMVYYLSFKGIFILLAIAS
jgi:hypothetical protein